MNTNNLIDPNQLTDQQLEDLLRARRHKNEQDRQAYKELVASSVPPAVQRLMEVSAMLAEAKAQSFGFFKAILDMKASVYSSKNQQQSHTFSTDKYSITLGYRVVDAWDDTVSEGEAKVNLYIKSLAQDEKSAKLAEMVFKLLKKDAKGNLRACRVVELKNMADKEQNVDFSDGVNIIMSAYKPVRSCWFIEAYYVNNLQQKVSIPLSISAVDFPEGFEFDFATSASA